MKQNLGESIKHQKVKRRSAWLWFREVLAIVKSVVPAVITVITIVVIGYLLVIGFLGAKVAG